ncbi:hypothetical protein [Streptomyces griseomycini]|uniref:Uncharacterized protein n=1 Tax=Streptomyces griseomycini TaxID=66895 RepID=A0A7W7PWK3_9ACTN|nr:hypothetical protein [Streptomyces griseomycini]MBB4902598.1 hypothetical protein [Streptomyces griseomycini]GGR54380.1 hypothetical protein GCM10015536_69690 [Streptomyces griseomycini]
MDSVDFTPKDIPTLRRAARYLRRTELELPNTAHQLTHDAILISALRLDGKADELGAVPPAVDTALLGHISRDRIAALSGEELDAFTEAVAAVRALIDDVRDERSPRSTCGGLHDHAGHTWTLYGRPRYCWGNGPFLNKNAYGKCGAHWPHPAHEMGRYYEPCPGVLAEPTDQPAPAADGTNGTPAVGGPSPLCGTRWPHPEHRIGASYRNWCPGVPDAPEQDPGDAVK